MTLRNTIYLAGTLVSACLALSASAGAQAVPTASTPLASIASNVPMLNGNYSYALTASELLELGNTGGTGVQNFEVLSGDLQYISPNKKYPTSLMYSAGLFLNGYAGHNTTYYQSLTATQGAILGHWRFNVADSASYLPQSPSIGLLGLPGLGDLGLQPLPVSGAPGTGGPINGVPPQGLLTNYANQVDNFLTGTISRSLNAKTTLSGTGGYGLFQFVDGGGVNSKLYMGEVDLNRRLDARDNLGANANYTVFTYGALGSFYVRSANLTFQRSWTRNLSTNISAGPELMSGFNTAPLTSQYFGQPGQGVFVPPALSAPVPAQINVGVTAGVNYQRRIDSASLFYMRGINGGSGIQIGAFSDLVNGTLQHSFSRVVTGSVFLSYMRTAGFLGYPPSTTEVGGVQLTRQLGRDWSVYGSYTGINQNVAAVLLLQNAYSGFYNTLAAGITFSPRPFHVNRF